MSGKPTTHVVYCSSTGKMLCCEANGNQIVDHSCGVIQQMSVPLGNLSISDGLTVMSSEEPKISVGTPSR